MKMFKRPVRLAYLIRIRAGAGVWTAELIYPEPWPEPLGDAVVPDHLEGHGKLQHAKIDASELLFGFGEVQYADLKENLWKAMSQEAVNDAQEDRKKPRDRTGVGDIGQRGGRIYRCGICRACGRGDWRCNRCAAYFDAI